MFLCIVAALGHPEMVTNTRLKVLVWQVQHGASVKVFFVAGDSMRERESENWGHLKSGGCHQRFPTPSKAHSFFRFL